MSLLAAQEVSLVGESGFSSLVAVRRLLIVGGFPCCGSGAPAHVGLGYRLSCLVWALSFPGKFLNAEDSFDHFVSVRKTIFRMNLALQKAKQKEKNKLVFTLTLLSCQIKP